MSTAQNKQSHRLKILIVCKNNQNIPVQKQKRELTVRKNQKQIFKNWKNKIIFRQENVRKEEAWVRKR